MKRFLHRIGVSSWAILACCAVFADPLVITVDDDLTELPTADYTVIQDAIDYIVTNGADGDIIRVYPGLYRECLEINPALASPVVSYVLESSNPRDASVVAATIIDADTNNDGNGDGIAIQFEGGETTDAAIRGFTIRNGFTDAWDGGGISGRRPGTGCALAANCGADALIEYNVITECEAERGGGIAWCNGIIRFNTIIDNHANVEGGGVGYCGEQNYPASGIDYTRTNIACNTIADNTSDTHGGGMSHIFAYVTHNIIRDNEAANEGGGIHWCGPAEVERNIICNNHANGSGGGLYDISEAISVDNNLIFNNSADGNGGGAARCLLSNFRHNVFYGNTAVGGGGGFYLASGSGTYVYNNIMWANTADTTSPHTNANFYYASESTDNTLNNAIDGHPDNVGTPVFIDADGSDNDLSTFEDNDFRIQSGALIDGGYLIEDFDVADNQPSLTDDFGGNLRPHNGDYDVGAYENPALPTLPNTCDDCWFYDTFDDVYNHHWTLLGNPMQTGTEASGNKYVYDDASNGRIFHAIEGDSYDFQFRYNALDITGSGSYAAIMLRYHGQYDSVTVRFKDTSAQLVIYKYNPSTNSSQLVTALTNSSITTTENVWYTVRARCEGANIVVERAVPGGNWESVFNISNSVVTKSGGIAIQSVSGTFAFDDVCIDLFDPPALASDPTLPSCTDAYACEDAEDLDISEWYLSASLSIDDDGVNHFVKQTSANAAYHVISDNNIDLRFSFYPLSNSTAFPTLQIMFKYLGGDDFYRIGMYPHYADVYNRVGGTYQPHLYVNDATWNAGHWYDVWIRSDLGQHTMWMRQQGFEWEEVFDFADSNLDATGSVVITTSTNPVVRWDNLAITPIYTNTGGAGWPTCTASILCDDFDDGNYTGWTAGGTWSVSDSDESSYYALGSSTSGTASTLTQTVTDTDITIGFSYKIADPWTNQPVAPGTSLTVRLRYVDGNNYNLLELNPINAYFKSRYSAVSQPTVTNWAAGSVPGRWYDVEIVCDGADVTVNRREQGRAWEELFSVSNATMTSNAEFQFRPIGGAKVRIDDVSIDN